MVSLQSILENNDREDIIIVFGNNGRSPLHLSYTLDLLEDKNIRVLSPYWSKSKLHPSYEDDGTHCDILIVLEPPFGYTIEKPHYANRLVVLTSHLSLNYPTDNYKLIGNHVGNAEKNPRNWRGYMDFIERNGIVLKPEIFHFGHVSIPPYHSFCVDLTRRGAHEAFLCLLNVRDVLVSEDHHESWIVALPYHLREEITYHLDKTEQCLDEHQLKMETNTEVQAGLKFASVGKQYSPSFLCHLNRVYIRNFFLFGFCLSLTRQIFGDAIICHYQDHRISLQYLEMECFINGTITTLQQSDGTTITINHFYYQWVSIILLMEALAFWLPFQLLWFAWFREFNNNGGMKNPEYIINEIRRSGRYAFWKTFGMEVIYVLNLILQAILLNMFLDFGISKGYTFHEIFPNRGTCYLDYFSGGGITTGRFICLLPLNIFYKKIFSIMYFGFLILLAIHCLVITSRLITASFPCVRRGGYFRDDVDRWWFFEIMKQNLSVSDMWELERLEQNNITV